MRHSASRRFAEQVESMAQGVAQRVIDLVLEALDLNALIARIDLNVVLGRVNLNQVIDRVDLNEVIDRVDLNEVLDHVDIDRLIGRVDMNKLLEQVDINEIVGRIDIEGLVKNTDLGSIMVSSSSTIATEAVDLGRSHAVSMDDALARWVGRLRHDNSGRAGPPELLDVPEES